MSGVSFQHDLKQKVIIRLPISFSFSGSCRFLSCSFLYNIFLCPLILSNFFLCLWSLLWRLQDPSSSCCGVCTLMGEVGWEVVPLSLWSELWLLLLWPEPALDIEASFPLALWLSLPCLWWGLLPGWWNRAHPDLFLRCDSDLWLRQVGLEHTHWERRPWGLLLWGCSPLCALWVNFTHCVSLMWPCVGTALGPTLTVGMPAHGPGVSQMLFSVGHQHRSSEVRSQNGIHHGAGPTVVLWQLRLWPGPAPWCRSPQSLQLLKLHAVTRGALVVHSNAL